MSTGEDYDLPFDVTDIPVLYRARLALETAIFYLGVEDEEIKAEDLINILKKTFIYWKISSEYSEKVIEAAKKLSEKELQFLSAFSKSLVSVTVSRKEPNQNIKRETVSEIPVKERFFSTWTEKGYRYGTEQEYQLDYKKVPASWGPRIWIDLIGGNYSILVNRKRIQIKITGQKLELLCFLLRNFNRRISKKDLEDFLPNFTVVLNELHKITCNVLRPFLHLDWGEARKLVSQNKEDRRERFTFCLIDYYSTPAE